MCWLLGGLFVTASCRLLRALLVAGVCRPLGGLVVAVGRWLWGCLVVGRRRRLLDGLAVAGLGGLVIAGRRGLGEGRCGWLVGGFLRGGEVAGARHGMLGRGTGLWTYRCLLILGCLALGRDLEALQLLGRQLDAYRRGVFPQVGPCADDGPMIRAQRGRAVRGHPAERPAGLVPVLHLLGDDTKIEGNAEHDRIGIPEPPLTSGKSLLEHPPSRRRIIGPLMHGRELLGGQQNIRIVLTKIGPPQLDGMLKHSARLPQITGIGKGQRTLPDGKKRGRLRHAGHAARYGAETPVRAGEVSRYVRARGAVRGWGRGRVYFSPVRPTGRPIAGANRRSDRLGCTHLVRVAEWQTR